MQPQKFSQPDPRRMGKVACTHLYNSSETYKIIKYYIIMAFKDFNSHTCTRKVSNNMYSDDCIYYNMDSIVTVTLHGDSSDSSDGTCRR